MGRPGLVAKKIMVRGKKGAALRTYWVKPTTGAGGAASPAISRLADVRKTRKWSDDRPAHFPAQTIDKYYSGHPDQGGRVKDPVRAKLHQEIKNEFLDHVKPVAPGEKKVAIMTMGAPASGKGGLKKGFAKDGFVDIDPDEIKGKLPEYQESMNPEKTYRGAAAMVHEESSALAKELTNEAIAQNKNVIVDGTGANKDSFIKKMNSLRGAGYEVNVAMPYIDVDEGMKRMLGRAEGSGRYVPEDVVRGAYEAIPKNIDSIMRAADTFVMVDNQRGGKPVIEKKKSGEIIVHDKAFMDDFYKKHPQNP